MLEQGGLANPGLPTYDESSARPIPRLLEQTLDQPLLGIPADQHATIVDPPANWKPLFVNQG
jgi:hypothetical protein